MSVDGLWRQIEAELTRSPAVSTALRPAITDTLLQDWSRTAGALPSTLQALYRGHEGTDDAGGGSGFCFIGNWYPLPVESAVASYEFFRPLTDMWGLQPFIPFAVDYTGCRLGIPVDGPEVVHIMFLDTPPGPYASDIEALMTDTVQGLRGHSDKYRANLTDSYLTWTNLDAEADDQHH